MPMFPQSENSDYLSMQVGGGSASHLSDGGWPRGAVEGRAALWAGDVGRDAALWVLEGGAA